MPGIERLVGFSPESQEPFEGRYKIPWDDPEFSRRMLAEHLSQEHDLASRRADKIAAQCRWIHGALLAERPSRILDLGCGPGLYLRELAALGHECVGIDFSPASIEYAKGNLPAEVELKQEDLLTADFGEGFDLVLFLYGELNVFAEGECRDLLRKAASAVAAGGQFWLEAHTFEAVEEMGNAPPTWSRHESGLFSDRPYLCLVESRWCSRGENAAQQFFHVIDAATATTHTLTSTTKAWTIKEYERMLLQAGFRSAEITGGWPEAHPAFDTWRAVQ
jgi:SAM-dependent methyltransferase